MPPQLGLYNLSQALRLRGLNARVVTGGVIRPGDGVHKL